VAVCADYTRPFPLPPLPGPPGKRVGFFPGSTIGNFEPDGVVRFLRHCTELLGSGCEMLIGADLKKAPETLNAAYNDRAGVNAAFNLNLLVRINRELEGDIDVDRFAHVAFYNAEAGRMELYLKSLAAQTVTVAGRRFEFAGGELVHTENSYKYAIDEFASLAVRAGFAVVHTWTDPGALFSVHYLRQQ
jgi:L-histidine N-alpha-methyltransferase